MILRWKSFTNIRISVSLRITSVHFPQILTINKTRENVGMILSSNLDRRKVNPLIYVTFWRQAFLPTLLFGADLFTLTPTLLLRLERCQSWFLKNIFYVPKFAPGPLLQKLSGLNSIGSEIAIKKLLLLGRLIKEPKMSPAVKSLFDSRTKSFFDSDITSLGLLPSIAAALHKYELFDHFENWHDNSTFPTYTRWKKLCGIRSSILRGTHGIASVNLT